MRVPQALGSKGSLKWIQRAVAKRPDLLAAQFTAAGALPTGDTIRWVSPVEVDGWAEYRDARWLDKIDCGELREDLSRFWPARGPQWDALGRGPGRSVFLIEAKARLSELDSNCQASEPSRKKISAAVTKAKQAFGVSPDANWLIGFYQYANRLAHLHFLRERGIPAWIGFVYFLGDPARRSSPAREDWLRELRIVHGHLGLSSTPRWVVDIFIHCQDLV